MNFTRFLRPKQIALHIITQNRCNLLLPTLQKCQRFFDVIRVCDGGSTDDTAEAVKSFGRNVKYYYRKWDDKYHEQDNYLLSFCKPNDWVMIQDDDECPTHILLQNLKPLITNAQMLGFNMLSMPALDSLDGVLACEIDEFVQQIEQNKRRPFRKLWLFKYDLSVKSFGSPHRSVETLKGWRVLDQPYPYIHTKTSYGFEINDCIHAWIFPFGQEYTKQQAAEMYAALPKFKTSRELEPWLKNGSITPEFIEFARKYKDSPKPVGKWWRVYERLHLSAVYKNADPIAKT